MRAADVTFLAELWVASWREAMPAIDFEARRAWLAAFLRDPAHETVVDAAHDAPAGFASWARASARQLHLHQLVVAPQAKGGGLACVLLARAKAEAPDGLVLDVNQANGRAVRFYTREGFAIVAPGLNPSSGLATWRMIWRRRP